MPYIDEPAEKGIYVLSIKKANTTDIKVLGVRRDLDEILGVIRYALGEYGKKQKLTNNQMKKRFEEYDEKFYPNWDTSPFVGVDFYIEKLNRVFQSWADIIPILQSMEKDQGVLEVGGRLEIIPVSLLQQANIFDRSYYYDPAVESNTIIINYVPFTKLQEIL